MTDVEMPSVAAGDAAPVADAAGAATQALDQAVLEALRPFLFAAGVGYLVSEQVNEAKPNQHTDRPLIAFGSYAGQFAAESRVSWADWLNLLEAADKAGLLQREAPHHG